ncbi:hypothetical protein [Falsibacillus pallidus]|uniref:Uncharacterized protein n=1 Tax=Falsibacillus pallidus TaxID=493781 RepID=A0A370GV18_9BACI|nr:hypothetical protein [Falsibacillus pallidus]RDI45773.1 hypothetical protein DFR59_102407 [Falsibacillus pallidus]
MYEELVVKNDSLNLEIIAEKYLLLLYRCLLNDGLTQDHAEKILSEVFTYIKKHPDFLSSQHKLSVRLIQLCRHFSNRFVQKEKKVKAIQVL